MSTSVALFSGNDDRDALELMGQARIYFVLNRTRSREHLHQYRMPNRRINLPQFSDQPNLVDASRFKGSA